MTSPRHFAGRDLTTVAADLEQLCRRFVHHKPGEEAARMTCMALESLAADDRISSYTRRRAKTAATAFRSLLADLDHAPKDADPARYLTAADILKRLTGQEADQ